MYFNKSKNSIIGYFENKESSFTISRYGKHAKHMAMLFEKTGIIYNNYFKIKNNNIIIFINSNKIGQVKVKFDYIDKYLLQYSWYIKVNEKNYIKVCSRINGKDISMSNLILGKKHNLIIDHIDRDTLNNTRDNLRFVDISTNNKNRTFSNNNLGLTGVTDKGNRYLVTWYEDNIRKSKTFSKNKYGAKALMKAKRTRIIKGLKNNYIFTDKELESIDKIKIRIKFK